MSTYYDDPIHYAVADAMIEHGPDGHIDGYAEIAEAAINAHLRLTPDEWAAKRDDIAQAIWEGTTVSKDQAVGAADAAMTALGYEMDDE